MKRTALIVLFLVYAAMFGANWVSEAIFERLPHLEDEVAYLFQARVFDHGDIYIPVKQPSSAYWQPFVIDCNQGKDQDFHTECDGRRFGKYPPGWPALLAFGTGVHLPWVVNLYFAGLTVALMYRLGRELYNETAGVIAALLMTISPIALLLNGTYMGHTAAHFFVLLALYGLWRVERGRHMVQWGIVAGASLGMVFLMRPLSAVALAFPLVIYSGLRLAWFGFQQLIPYLKQQFPALERWHDRDGAISDAVWIYLSIWLVIGLYISEYSLAKLLDKVYRAFPESWKDAFFSNSITFSNQYTETTPTVILWLWAIPLGIIAIVLLWLIFVGAWHWRRFSQVLNPLLMVAFFAVIVGSAYFGFNYEVTGNPTVNMYRMIWSYDRVGFGGREQYGRFGHSPQEGWETMLVDTQCYARDLLGWVEQPDNPPPGEPATPNECKVDRRGLSWILLLPGLAFMGRRRWSVLLLAVAACTILVHVAYWIGAGVFSARYYFEATGPLLLVSAAGAAGIARLLQPFKLQAVLHTLLGILVGASLIGFTPQRLEYLKGYSCTNREYFRQIEALRESPDKKVVVIAYGVQNGCKGRPSWRDYGPLLAVTDPYLENDIILLRDLDQKYLPELLETYSDRQIMLMLQNHIYPMYSAEEEASTP